MVHPERKLKLLTAFCEAFTRFNQVIIIELMNISNTQIVKTRISLRKENGLILVGKNTIAKLAIRLLTSDDDKDKDFYTLQQKYGKRPGLGKLIEQIKGKVGFVFCDKSYIEIKAIIEREIVKSPAKPGIIAPQEVVIPAGPTNVDPGRIGDFSRIGMQTKTVRGAIEITKDFNLCKKGEIVTETVSQMCRLLNIIPFHYALSIKVVYLEGCIIPNELLDV